MKCEECKHPKYEVDLDNGITACKFCEPNIYYTQMATRLGLVENIMWARAFDGEGREYWEKLYAEDWRLDKHPLERFDWYHSATKTQMKKYFRKRGWSLYDNMNVLKAAIRIWLTQEEEE